MYALIKKMLFLLEPETAHGVALGSLRILEPILPLFSSVLRIADRRLETTVFGLKFPNPIGLAAGLDKKGQLPLAWERVGFGFAELGTFTAKAQKGNPMPRVFRYPGQKALINSMGFPNEGSHEAAKNLKVLKETGRWPSMPIGINLGKSKITPLEEALDDYLESMKVLKPYADYFTINVSSPNTLGLRKLQEAKPLKKLLTALVKEAKGKPVLLKLAPDLADKPLQEAASVALSAGCAGLIATNTTLSREGLPAGKYPDGGLSGQPLKLMATKVLKSLSRFTKGKVPLVAVGGIFTPQDVQEKLEAGASLVQVYTGYIYEGPFLLERLCRGLLKEKNEK